MHHRWSYLKKCQMRAFTSVLLNKTILFFSVLLSISVSASVTYFALSLIF